MLLESVQRRADDLERTLETTNQRVEELKLVESDVNNIKSKCLDLESRLTATEKEKDVAQRDLHKYREVIEVNIGIYIYQAFNLLDVYSNIFDRDTILGEGRSIR